ncbi:T9SS type A sorting domain-containing protein [Fluviicola chungangensis]|uniref:T9SS type A sorting domain-containing protein n=1 Tax=Fluviicola chungangensis TaxID=2597671 RepID=A0A556MJ74_9FLAO|nr:T9SS type A sorting domain-containing protein [Fluviicola chungangensis]TSJ39919.1 T9SS type A sorting domain-containing protein [Fluviicola chungangensis]
MKIITFLLFTGLFSVSFSQNSLSFDFAEAFHNKDHYGSMHYMKMTTDSLGNHYIAGGFHGIIDLDPSSTENLIQALDGEEKVFLAKYSLTGQLLWQKTTFLDTDSDILDIHSDQSGNVYLSGEYSDSIDLDFNGNQIIHSGGQHSKFLAKYTSNGSLIWHKSFRAQYFHFNLSNNNEVIATGTFQGNIDLGAPGNPYLLNGSAYNIFLTRFATNGNVLWAKSTAYNYPTDLNVCGIGSDANGNICISGVFTGVLDADFDSGSYPLNTSYGISSYYVGIYFCKYTANGSITWAKMSTGLDWVDLQQFRVNQSGEMLIMGKFGGTRDFSVTSGQNTITASSTDNVFVVKYDNMCNLVYVNKMTSSAYNVPFWDVVLSDNGHCYMLSRKSHTIYTANDTLNHFSPAFDNKSDLSRLEFDSIGNVEHEYFFEIGLNPANQNSSYGYAVSFGSDGNLVVLGEAGNLVDMDQTSSTLYSPKTNTYFLTSFLNTGEINWCSFIGTNGDITSSGERTTGIVFDGQGGSFVTGHYRQQVDLDLTTNVLYSDSGSATGSAYLSYYDQWNELMWSHSFSGNNVTAAIPLEPVLDSDENVLVTISYIGNLVFTTPLNNYTDTLADQGIKHGLFKFDNNGGLIWAKKIFTEVTGSVSVTDVELNTNNEIFMTGVFSDTIFFNLQGVESMLVSNGSSEDIFVARVDANGELIWIRSLGSVSVERSFQILPDGTNNFYLSGSFSGTVNMNLNGGVNNYTSINPQATFFARYSNTGNIGYVKILNTTYTPNINEFKKDNTGNLILAGSFKGVLDCDPSSATYNLTSNSYNSFIAKYTSSGQLTWAKSFETYSVNEIKSFIIDSVNNILVGGQYLGDIQFSANPDIHRTSVEESRDIFLVYLNETGQINNVFSFGTLSPENLTCITYKDDLIGVTGEVAPISMDLDPSGNIHSVRSYNDIDGFIAKYQLCSTPQVSILWDFVTMTASVSGVDYQWVNGSTNEAIPGADQQYFTPTEGGSYYVVISTPDGCTSSSQTIDIVNLGLEEVQKGQITLYPNPTSSIIAIKTENPSDSYKSSIYSLSGTLILTQNLNGNSTYNLDVSAWPQGVYLIRLDSENESQVFKIVKN